MLRSTTYLDSKIKSSDCMADSTTELEAFNAKIKELEDTKTEMIDRIRYLMRRIKYKKFEQKALEPYLEQTRDVQIMPLRKRKSMIEFQIATAAYTPRLERDMLKEARNLEKQLEAVKEVEKARRKKRYVDEDISRGEEEIQDIEKKLVTLRDNLRRTYDDAKSVRMAAKRSAMAASIAEEDMVALGDMAMIETKGPKAPKKEE